MSNKIMSEEACCSPESRGPGHYRLHSILSIDDRGQMVLPKEVRDKAGIRAGDKLALVSWERDGKICCMSLLKVDELSGMVKNVLEPLMKNID